MRKILLFSLILFSFVSTTQAQSPAPLERLVVDIWSDFDQEAVLVILTGEVVATSSAFVTVPIPEAGEIHVVARMDNAGNFSDDLTYNTNADSVTFTLDDPGFRIEYYMPYQTEGDLHQFDFIWESPAAINQFIIRVQQPPLATPVELSIPSTSITQEFFGLDHYNLPAQTLAPNETVSLSVSYELASGALTEEALVLANDTPPSSEPAAIVEDINVEPNTPATTNQGWIIAGIGGVLLGIGILWWGWRQQQVKPVAKRPRKHQAKPKQKTNKYCHQCGIALQAKDKFCRNCGTPCKKQ